MRVLVIGSGGREHALCWAIARSPLLTKLWCAPGNPGIAQVADCLSIGAMDMPALVAFAQREEIDLVVPGPEGPLVAGISDLMAAAGIRCCGPTHEAAKLESSKLFGKQICEAAGIPTASWRCFNDAAMAKTYIRQNGRPLVIKADGLAAGKGVKLPDTEDEAMAAIDAMMTERVFGDAGANILIEERLTGEEFSFFALCDGSSAIPFGVAQDHKRLKDGDTGANTGGMGAYSPPNFSDARQTWVMQSVILPTLAEMAKRGTPFRGILFAGLMDTPEGIKLIEFNVRFGDPECQALVLRMRADLLGALRTSCDGGLDSFNMVYDATSIAVVLAAPGYPEAPEYGSRIGLGRVVGIPGVQVFHAGTELVHGQLQAAGGRVLTVCGLGEDAENARALVYSAIERIDWPEACFRQDIGWRAFRPPI